ncbi:TMEM175 family protein [Lysobacter sp. HA18]
MNKGRLEAFSDGVLAIIITIMVLELRAPAGSDLESLRPLLPVFVSYVLSFIYVGIYWNNHHHFLRAATRIDGRVMWANLHLLFWLSMFPFATAWMGEHHDAATPVAMYGVMLMMAAIAWLPFQASLMRASGSDWTLSRAVDPWGWKSVLPVVFYLTGISLAFVNTWAAQAMYAAVAVMWFVPDRRIEHRIQDIAHHEQA